MNRKTLDLALADLQRDADAIRHATKALCILATLDPTIAELPMLHCMSLIADEQMKFSASLNAVNEARRQFFEASKAAS